jgi:hypothetical protein
MLVTVAVLAAVALLALLAWRTGWLSRSSVLSLDEARLELDRVMSQVADERLQQPEAASSQPSLPAAAGQIPSRLDETGEPASEPRALSGTPARERLLDAAVPASLAFVNGAIDWATPDQAAITAVSQMTHEDITSALDLHTTLAEHQYQLLTEGSMTSWSGHVGEAQIAEQIDSWAGEGTASLAENSNYAGADISFFDHDFQVKFYSDFNDIENIHGDTLIVNEDAANIPTDALHVDFSEPFDPSILDGHDVIVAEGLTIAGADDAWESAAGLAAGGIDGADVLDAGGDAMIPGIGAAIRVARSGYKRRSALADRELRGRATGKVARDAAAGVVGAGGGATVGMILGSLVDAATLGATLGMGAVVGGMIGAAAGGSAAGAASRAADRKAVESARNALTGSITRYGLAVEASQTEANQRWAQARADADAEASRLAAERIAQMVLVEQLTTAELAALRSLSWSEADRLLDQAAASVEQTARSERSPWARRRQREWRSSTDLLRLGRDRSTADVEEVLLHVAASPGGTDTIRAWLNDRIDRRTTVLAASARLMDALRLQAVRDRVSVVRGLGGERRDIQEQAKKRLDAPIKAVEVRVKALRDELVVAGYLSREDANRLHQAGG